MINIVIFPACLECAYSDIYVDNNIVHSYIRCDHTEVCKLIEGQQPIIDTYDMSIEDARENYSYKHIKAHIEYEPVIETVSFAPYDRDIVTGYKPIVRCPKCNETIEVNNE